jgi:hypothetical protein
MPIVIRVISPDPDQETASLHAWLNAEPGIRQHAQIRLVASKLDMHEMGGGIDLLQLVVDDGFQALNHAGRILAMATDSI